MNSILPHLCTLDGGANIPYLGEQLKYCTPPTEPSFLPCGFSSSIPYHCPGMRMGGFHGICTVAKAAMLLPKPKDGSTISQMTEMRNDRHDRSAVKGKVENKQGKRFTKLHCRVAH